MKTKLQKQFEEQTPTIKGASTKEYLQTFVTWLHFQVEKLTPEISDQDKIKMYLKRYPNIRLKGFSGADIREAYFRGIEDTISKGGSPISEDNRKVRPLTEGREKRNSKKNPSGRKTSPPPKGTLPPAEEMSKEELWDKHCKITKRGYTVYETMTFKEFEAALNELKNK